MSIGIFFSVNWEKFATGNLAQVCIEKKYCEQKQRCAYVFAMSINSSFAFFQTSPYNCLLWLSNQVWDGPEVIKLFFMLSSAETKIYPAHKC